MLRLNPDGTADIEYQDVKVHLDMPTLAQFGDLLDLVDERWRRLDGTDAEREALEARKGNASDDELKTLAQEARRLDARTRQLAAETMIEAVQLLASKDQAKKFAENPPAWAYKSEALTRLVHHFSTVPFLGPGEPGD